MSNLSGWLVPEVPMPHPEGQRSLTYCINPREGDTNACRLQREAPELLLPLGLSEAIVRYRNQSEPIGLARINSDKFR